MCNLVMDIINAFSFLLIPGFLALFLFLETTFKAAGGEAIEAGLCRLSESRYTLKSTLKPVKK